MLVKTVSFEFKSKIECERFFKKRMYEIGVCTDVKDEQFYDLIKLHYHYAQKSVNMKTLGIEKCENGLRLVIHNEHDTTEISLKCCLSNPPSTKSEFTSALRTSVQSQIWKYKNNFFPSMCAFCEEEATEVDHIITFKTIIDEFMAKNNITMPLEYRKQFKTHHKCFLEDEPIEKMFQEYHQSHATFRPLCRKCNVGRNKG